MRSLFLVIGCTATAGLGFCATSTGEGLLVDPLADVDADGYTVGDDCNDADASVRPNAGDVCDGKDNNCDGILDNWRVVWRNREVPSTTWTGGCEPPAGIRFWILDHYENP